MYDVGVLGVGSMGSMALWQLARRGVRAIGFEQFSVGHDRGAAGGETRIFRTAYRESPDYVPFLLRARQAWRDLEADTGTGLLDLMGVATVGREDDHHVRGVLDCLRRFDLDAEVLDHREANRRYPAVNVFPGEVAVIDKAGGLAKPERAVVAAVRHAEAHGATVMRRARVLGIEPDATGVWVRTEHRDVRVGRLVLCAGAWAGRFLNGTVPGLVTPHRLVLSWFVAQTPELFHRDRFPVVNRVTRGADFSVFPSQDGNAVKAGLNIDVGPIETPDDLQRAVAFPEVSRICAIVEAIYPDLWPEPIRSASYTDGFTADEHAVIGPIQGLPSVVVGTGFSAHGFKMAPAVGAALADLATLGTTDMPIQHLSPDRPRVTRPNHA